MTVRGELALHQWLLACPAHRRGRPPDLSRAFGVRDYTEIFGNVDPSDVASDLRRRFQRAIIAHDRVADLEDFKIEWRPEDGVVQITRMVILLDDPDAVATLTEIPLDIRGELGV